MKVLILRAGGMIGSTVFRVLSENKQYETFGTVRDGRVSQYFPASMGKQLIEDIDVENHDSLVRVLEKTRPDMVVNCAGLTKHKPGAENPLVSLPINTSMPHRLAELCGLVDVRLIHISTDCVFSGEKAIMLKRMSLMHEIFMASRRQWVRCTIHMRLRCVLRLLVLD